ncbi:MAG: D-glycero-beta-D-manno-heptose 1-phosphate adenylyltransferase [Chitinophagaceae bacterium]
MQHKLFTKEELKRKIAQWRLLGKTIAFTNGCFDILHAGHITSLNEAAQQADVLVVALNTDQSVKKLKGEARPLNNEASRALLIASLVVVDAVILFGEDTPKELIIDLMPDVLVKGGDYKIEDIAGAKEVIDNGGKVVINPIVQGYSTTGLINKIQHSK